MNSVRLLTVILILFYVALGISAPLITLYLEELGASYATISLILASAAAVLLLSHTAWGRLSDWLGRRRPLIIVGLLGLGLSYLLLSFVSSPVQAWPVWLLERVSGAAYLTASLALMGDFLADGQGAGGIGQRRGRRMGSYRGMGSLAFALGAFTGGALADNFSLVLTWRVCAGLYLAAALVGLALRESRNPYSVIGNRSTEYRTPNTEHRLPLPFLAGVLLWTTALFAAASMWPNFMVSLGYSKMATSSLWGLAALVEAPAMWLTGILSDLVGRMPLLIAGGIGIAAVMVGYIGLARWLPALLGVQIGRGLAYGSYTTASMTLAAEWGEARWRGSNSGLFHAASGGGNLLGLLIGGTLVQLRGFEFLFAICAASALLSAVCFWLMRGRRQQAYPAQSEVRA